MSTNNPVKVADGRMVVELMLTPEEQARVVRAFDNKMAVNLIVEGVITEVCGDVENIKGLCVFVLKPFAVEIPE